ncbi:helicase [Trinickia dabaoshanensis]|uniref:helicase n=1 Tax=Trinickia dabaoshanensis TaxID=564714 RepID=UPI001E57F97A|nr:helicase [Trinickia dabaoshanensis]
MNAPIRNDRAHSADLAQQAQASAEHNGQTLQVRGFARLKVQHTKMQRARMQHNQMLAAAFYRGKRFAEGNRKPPPPSAQKLMRELGQRPRPGSSTKGRGKEGAAQERPELAHGPEPKHEHERKHEEGQQQKHGQQQKRDREHEHEQDQQQRQHHGGHEHGQQQDQGGDGRQPQQNAPRDGQQKREGQDSREGRDKPRKFAVGKAGRAKAAARKQPLDTVMQALAQHKLGAPDLPSQLAHACTKEVLRLTKQLELGSLLAVPLLMSMTSPMALRRNAARLQAHRGAALAQHAASPGKAAATAGLIGVSLDNTLARQSAGIEYSDDDQSIAMIKQRILDALGTPPAAAGGSATSAASANTGASDKALEVRTAQTGPGAKT